jgi:c-di-GMP phosphodiesterase
VSVIGTRSAYHARPIDDQREENAAPRGPLVTQGRWSCSGYLERGFDGFQGTFFSRPEPLPSAEMPQSTVAAMRLMGLARDPNVSDQQLTDVIAIDPVLTFQLLRLVNSAALGGRGVASIGQALRLIGRGAFLRWLAVAVAAARKSKNGIDQELVRQAVERGRLCEQLVGTGRDAGTLFLVGLFSLLDVVFRMPLAEILERVVLSTEANDALLERTGPYADAITFAESYELGLFENAAGIAREMGVDPAKAGEFYTNAITWTAEALGAVLDSQAAMPVKKAS